MAAEHARATIVVTPRERFNVALQSLDSIYEHTDGPFELIYVDGRSPAAVRKGIEERAARHGFRVVRSDRYLSPNEARNLGFAGVDTEFVVFVDNDLLVTDGWLQAMIDRADATGAWAVGPLYFEGDPADEIIHMAGGVIEVRGEHGHRSFTTEHLLQGAPLAEAGDAVQPGPCDFVEFHCMLVRSDRLRQLGPLDEALRSTREHLDLCLAVHDAGGTVWFEPAARVTYSTPPPVALRDVPYFWLRWSEAWTAESLDRFIDKHGIDPTYAQRAHIMRARRQVVFDPLRHAIDRTLGARAGEASAKVLRKLEPPINRVAVRRRPAATPAR
ncbi:MAG: glycosyltransferase family 2 protein [Acidimicrobiia bacterium]